MKKGFTLIELLAVVLIIGILTAIAVPQYRKSVERSRLAEASQLLPAIYDARDRWVVEQGYTWRNVDTWKNLITFSKLDLSLKGHVGTSGRIWETNNFSYTLFVQGTQRGNYPVTGRIKKGIYENTVIAYNGASFECYARAASICEALNIPVGTNLTYSEEPGWEQGR